MPSSGSAPNRYKLCVIFNTCGLIGRENAERYIEALTTLLDQDFQEFRVVLSDCFSPPALRDRIRQTFARRMSYSFIDDVRPVFTTFNWSTLKAIEAFGCFEAYVYVDSGISFGRDRDTLQKLYDRFQQHPGRTGMVAVSVDGDNSGYAAAKKAEPFDGGEVRIGEHINLHCLLISEKVRQAYGGKCLPDAFAGIGSEGTYPYLCSAVRTKLLITTNTPALAHLPSLDGPNQGFPEGANYGLYLRKANIWDIAARGAAYGFGFEEFVNDRHVGDRSRFDPEGLAMDDQLYEYLKENLFLLPSELNYATIRGSFIP